MPETNDDLPTLKRTNVFMKDRDNVIQMIQKIRNDGTNKLQVVSDFDLTVTKQHVDGKHVLSSFGIFWKCEQLPEEAKTKANTLYAKFRPIELDPHLDLQIKIDAMQRWMTITQDMLQDIPFDKTELEAVSKEYGTDIRDGTKELFEKLNKANVPILVFSAGLGDVVKHVLNHHDVLLDNVKVISNFLKYQDDKINGFKNELLIHVFNKNEHAVDKEYFNVLEGRTNVILMGDMEGDASMANGVKDVDTILKIGFLYEKVESRLPKYLEAFDIVLVDDQTMDVVNDILRTMF